MKTQQTSNVSIAEIYFGIAAIAGMSVFGGYNLLSKQGASTKREVNRAVVRPASNDEFSELAAPQQRGDLRKAFLNNGKE